MTDLITMEITSDTRGLCEPSKFCGIALKPRFRPGGERCRDFDNMILMSFEVYIWMAEVEMWKCWEIWRPMTAKHLMKEVHGIDLILPEFEEPNRGRSPLVRDIRHCNPRLPKDRGKDLWGLDATGREVTV